jgi:hypothetical protein
MAGLDLGAGDGGGFPVRAQLQRLFGFVQGAQVVAALAAAWAMAKCASGRLS